METGIVRAGIIVATGEKRKKYITAITITIEINNANLTSEIDSSIKIDWS